MTVKPMNSWGTLEKETGKRFSPELNITDTNANEELVRKQKKKGIWKGEGIEVTNPSWRKWEPHIRGQGKRKRKRAAEEKTNLSSLFTWQKFRFCECCCKHNNNLYFQETFNAFNFFCGCSQKVALLNWSPHLQLYAWKPKKTTSSRKSCIALNLF